MASGAPSVGRRLFDSGWRQGSLLEAPPRITVCKLSGQAWQPETLPTDGVLVVATQTCDLVRDSIREPNVELIRAFWTNDKSKVSEASKNSNRLFLLRTEDRDGVKWGLVADATARMFVDKSSLAAMSPLPGCVATRERDFQRWLARRYDRPAVPEPLDRAVHQPVVKALREERRKGSRIAALLDGVADVRYVVDSQGPPFEIALFLVPEDGTLHAPITAAEAEEVQTWFLSTIGRTGDARVVRWEMWPLEVVSVVDYFESTPLSLYEFST